MRRFADKIPWTTLLSITIAGFPLFALLIVTSAAYAIRWAELSDQIEGHRLEIKKVGWIADNSDRLSVDLATVGSSRSSEPVLGAGDPELAGVDLQKNVKTLLDAATMQISSIQPLSVSDENGIRFVSIRAQASGTYENALAFLKSAYSSAPLVLIGAVDLMPDPTQQSGAGDTAGVKYLLQFEAVRLMAVEQ